MAVSEAVKSGDGLTQLSADPNVVVPEHVRRASAAAEAIHQQHYPKDLEQAPAPNKEALPQPPAPEPLHTQQQPDPAPQPEPQPQPQPVLQPDPADQNVSAEDWRHRFLSMQGRYHAEARKNGSMEQQMTELGQELVRTQSLLSQQAPHAAQLARSDTPHANLITDEDRANYGDEMIDLALRAAKSVVTPEIEQLRADNQRLTQRVQNTGKRELFATLDGKLPNWRAINTSPQFINWLRLPNVYTGQIRQQMLKAAVDGAEAPKVIALFRDFLTEVQATGQTAPAAQFEQLPAPQEQAPRAPALNLETLAAPGRARPASGNSQMPADKPIYSRAQITNFYAESRKGLWAGREAEYRAQEADFQAAMAEGRIR